MISCNNSSIRYNTGIRSFRGEREGLSQSPLQHGPELYLVSIAIVALIYRHPLK